MECSFAFIDCKLYLRLPLHFAIKNYFEDIHRVFGSDSYSVKGDSNCGVVISVEQADLCLAVIDS